MENVLAILLAGGAGERLYPLTRNIAKPAVPFGGVYRIIDFTLSNCVNSGLRRVLVLTQYKSLELIRHLRDAWSFLPADLGEYIEAISPMKRIHEDWYLGTADAVYQNIESIIAEAPAYTLILSGDHIYKMDYGEMLNLHRIRAAEVTVATLPVDPRDAPRYGIAAVDPDGRLRGFEEKPAHGQSPRSPFDPERVSASMGIYLFETGFLLQALMEDADDPDSTHDFGCDILPRWIPRAHVAAYDFRDLNDKSVRYWRDVGTLDTYFEANLDLVSVTPEFNLYDRRWPIRTHMVQQPPAKFVFAQEGRRMGVGIDSIVSPGCIVSGGRVLHSVLGPGVRVNSYCEVEDCILMPGVEVGRYSRLRRAIVDTGVRIPEASVIGYDLEADRARGCEISEGGVVVVASQAQAADRALK
ncbi:MAG: glucose-1-phosphate adenylyltransferase [Acidobacteria bacterium]|nr:glucose-1-phosphate adenylyltransferase [Acidobacteriota bacterium]